jgi:hypothetical protein
MVEEEAMEVGKTWNEVKRIAVDWIRWKRFTDALCSRGSNRNLLLLLLPPLPSPLPPPPPPPHQKNVSSANTEFLVRVYTLGLVCVVVVPFFVTQHIPQPSIRMEPSECAVWVALSNALL